MVEGLKILQDEIDLLNTRIKDQDKMIFDLIDVVKGLQGESEITFKAIKSITANLELIYYRLNDEKVLKDGE